MLGFPSFGVLFWCRYNMDYFSISGSILGSPYCGKVPYVGIPQGFIGIIQGCIAVK